MKFDSFFILVYTRILDNVLNVFNLYGFKRTQSKIDVYVNCEERNEMFLQCDDCVVDVKVKGK